MTTLLRRRRLIAVVVVVTLAVAAVAAWAYWSTSGSGTAVASLGTLSEPGKPTASSPGASINLSWSAASVSGGGTVRYHVERRTSSGSTWTDVCGSSDAAPITGLSCTDSPAFGSYVYRVTARFGSWHTTGPESDPVSPNDATPPSFGAPALSFAVLGGAAYYPGSGTSVFYNGTAGAGSITVSAPNVADTDSGIQKVEFPSPAGFSGGGDDTASPYSATYTWSSSSATGSQTVTAFNGSGATAATNFSLVRDVTAPTGGAVTVAGTSSSGTTVDTDGSYSITGLAQYVETPSATASGLASSSLVREQAVFDSDGTCDSNWTNAVTIAANRTENSGAGIATGNCYRYTLKGTDRVGNAANIQITVKVDTTGPSFGAPAVSIATSGGAAFYPGSGTSVYYNGNTGIGTGSSITVNAPNVSDAQSGIQKVNFPAPAGFSGGGDDTASPFSATYTWTTSAANGSQTLTATNGANATATTNFTLVRDVTAPGGGDVAVAGTSASPAGSSVGNATGSYSITSLDQYAENQNGTNSGLTSSSLVREQAGFDASGNCDSTWTNPTTIAANRTENAATGIASGNCYRYTVKGTDRVGNSASVQVTVKVDTSAPSFGSPALTFATSGGAAFYPGSGASVYYNGNTGAGTGSSITVSAPNAADPDSGIQKVNFPAPAGFGGGGDDTTSPFGATYTWTSSSATGSQTVTATNAGGGTATSTFSLVRDIAAPTGGALTVAGASTNGSSVGNNTGSYTISAITNYVEAQTASASGLGSSSLVREETDYNVDGSCATTWTNATTISATGTENAATGIASGNCYRYTLKGLDNVANAASIAITVKVDTAPPTATDVLLGNGGTLGRLGVDDSVTITYSEALDAATICNTWLNNGSAQTRSTVIVTVTNSGTNDLLGVSASSGCALNVGTVALGADYVTANKSYSGTGGNASSVSWNPVTRKLTITLGSGTAGELLLVPASTPSYTPNATIEDLVGNAIASGPYSGTGSRF